MLGIHGSRNSHGNRSVQCWHRTHRAGRLPCTIKVNTTDSSSQFLALLAFQEQRRDGFTASLISWLSGNFALVLLVLVMDRAESVVRVHLLMLSLRLLSSGIPNLLFGFRQRFPAVPYSQRQDGFVCRQKMALRTDDFGQRAVIGLDRSGNVLLADKVGAEEHEGIRRAGDVSLRTTLARWGTATRCTRREQFCGREKGV